MPRTHEQDHEFQETGTREYIAYDRAGNIMTLEARVFECIHGCNATYDVPQVLDRQAREEVTSNVE